MTASGVYQARVVSPFANGIAVVLIPQLFGEVQVSISRFTGSELPLTPVMGWVMFEGGEENYPVWLGSGSSGTVTESDPLGSLRNPFVTEDPDFVGEPPWDDGEYWERAMGIVTGTGYGPIGSWTNPWVTDDPDFEGEPPWRDGEFWLKAVNP